MASASKGIRYRVLGGDGWESLSPYKWHHQNQVYRKIARTHLIIELLLFINSTRNSQEISISLVW
jgi:hypothetical protein